jgi:hypothetical protein
MRTEDRNKCDSTILGLNNLYVVDYEGNYYINLPAIMAIDKKFTKWLHIKLKVKPLQNPDGH